MFYCKAPSPIHYAFSMSWKPFIFRAYDLLGFSFFFLLEFLPIFYTCENIERLLCFMIRTCAFFLLSVMKNGLYYCFVQSQHVYLWFYSWVKKIFRSLVLFIPRGLFFFVVPKILALHSKFVFRLVWFVSG